MNKPVLVIDSQILNNYDACPSKAYYSFVMNAKTKIKATALDEGDMMHYMMKFHYKLIKHNQEYTGISSIKGHPISRFTIKEISEIVKRKAEKYLLSLDLDAELGMEVYRTYNDYWQYYSNETWQILEIESPFARVLHEDDELKIIYCGVIDLLTNVAIVDHKTSSRRGEPTGLSNQFMGYCWALGTNNLVINKIGFQKTLKNEEKFERYTKSYPPELINEWKENTICKAKSLYKDLLDIENMSRKKNYTSCDKYSGCIFQKVCETVPEARDFVIQRDYLIGEPWKPLKTLEVI